MRIGLPPEGKALVDGDVANAEFARFFDHCEASVVVEKEPFPVRSPLRVCLPRSNAIASAELVHPLEVAGLIRVYPAMQKHPMRALEPLDDLRCCRGFLDGQRLRLTL